MIYFDSSYLMRLYHEDFGFQVVRDLAATDTIACGQHGQAEVIAAFHRKYHEGGLTFVAFRVVLQQFTDEIRGDAFRWLPLHRPFLTASAQTSRRYPKGTSFAPPMRYTWPSLAKMHSAKSTLMTGIS